MATTRLSTRTPRRPTSSGRPVERASRKKPVRTSPARAFGWGIALIVVALLLIVLAQIIPLSDLFLATDRALGKLGPFAPFVCGLGFVLAMLLCLPAAVLSIIVGGIFGVVMGTLIASAGTVGSAALAFVIGRKLARARIVRWTRGKPRLEAIDQVVSTGDWILIVLIRISPVIPLGASNYLFGASGVRFVPYLFTTWIATLPSKGLYAYLGYIGRETVLAGAGTGELGAIRWILLLVGVVALLSAASYVSYRAHILLEKRTRGALEV